MFCLIVFSLLTMVLTQSTMYAIVLNYYVTIMHILYSTIFFIFFAKQKLFVSICGVVCSYLTCTVCETKTRKALTVNKIFLYIENKMISVKFKLQVNGN